jgi:hypothetical protein
LGVLWQIVDWLDELRRDRAALAWMAIVAFFYFGATFVISQLSDWDSDHMMILAVSMSQGRFDLPTLTTINDIVTMPDGRHYQAMSLLPTVPYFILVPFKALWPFSRWIVSAVIGTFAAWLALPVARRYGPGGAATWWLAVLGAFGTMLFTLAIEGDFYYLAHLESTALMFLLLLEWRGSRRPWALAALIGLAALARPTLGLVAIPVGTALLWDAKDRPQIAFGFAWPLAAAVAITGWFDWARFGDPLQTGYGLSWLTPAFDEARSRGMFSVVHLPTNLGLFLVGGFDLRTTFPWLVPSVQGHSILLTTPALLLAFAAPWRIPLVRVLWGAVIVTSIPVFLYYGGGGANTYGYRYAMDFVPFMLPLIAIALRDRFGNLEKALIGLSVCFVTYGYVWQIYK